MKKKDYLDGMFNIEFFFLRELKVSNYHLDQSKKNKVL